jgi:S-formylglutathione hydrolase FrmB
MLLSTWFYVALVALTATPLVVWLALDVLRYRRRRRGQPVLEGWRVMLLRGWALMTALLFGVLTTAVALNRQYQYIPSFAALAGDVSPDLVTGPGPYTAVDARGAADQSPPKDHDGSRGRSRGREFPPPPTHGTVLKVQIGGGLSAIAPRDAYVYLPPQYFDAAHPDIRFPVLYLLHGSPGIAVDWLRGGKVDVAMDQLLQAHAMQPFIVVLPDVNGGYARDTECQDIPGGPQTQTYLTTDVPKYIDTHYRTFASRAARVIGGLSSGGYCGLNLSLRHPDVFSGALLHSGFLSPARNRYTGDLFGRDPMLLLTNSPSYYIPTVAITPPYSVYFDVGRSEKASLMQSKLGADMLKRRGVPVTLRIDDNAHHNFDSWHHDLAYSLPWVSAWFDTTHARAQTPA